jgi:alpha-amylase/alpha-mannosidase (GH57 family)|tara:strand:- start:270 stop:494 length:225 start_codon:yes stop_codon:yes gene_type:complete
MLKYFIIIINIFYLVTSNAFSDINIIKNGKILESKLYSTNEATLIVSNSRKIYVCSVSNSLTKCILSNKKYKIN